MKLAVLALLALLCCCANSQSSVGAPEHAPEPKPTPHPEPHNQTECETWNDNCGDCTAPSKGGDGCLWCQKTSKCSNFTTAASDTCEIFGWCAGDSCTCSIFPTTSSIPSQIMMILIYALFLGIGAKVIADGAELLLEILPNWGTIIGGLLLPILGALPDGIMIMFSGLGGTAAEAQSQLGVGVGTLAGSTIMLLTIPWSASIWVARTDIVNGVSIDKQRTITGAAQMTQCGTTVDRDTVINARIAIGASLTFFILQGVAFEYLKNPDSDEASKIDHPLSLAGFIICLLAFFAYCVYQILVPKLAEKRQQKAEELAANRRMNLRALHVVSKMRKHAGMTLEVQTEDPMQAEAARQEQSNAAALAAGLMWKRRAAAKAGTPVVTETAPLLKEEVIKKEIVKPVVEDSDSESGEKKEEEPFGKALAKAIFKILIGTAVVAFFSDPMVDVISEFGESIGIPAFYLSFLITPFCSNASELIASIQFAAKRKTSSSSMTFSQLYGAATMNSTFGLAIFYALIYFRGLVWEFSAETVTILIITWMVCGVSGYFQTYRVWFIIPNLVLYPFSLFLVYALENWAGWK